MSRFLSLKPVAFENFVRREVLPYVPDAWVDTNYWLRDLVYPALLQAPTFAHVRRNRSRSRGDRARDEGLLGDLLVKVEAAR